jgi:glycosyltransferase involved in cell wall biosynthesis
LYEGFGMPLVEAMVAGIPIACSTGGSIPEVAGDAALYFDPYSVDEMAAAIDRIVNEENLRKTLIAKGNERVKIFMDNDAMIDDYIRVFEEVMEEK